MDFQVHCSLYSYLTLQIVLVVLITVMQATDNEWRGRLSSVSGATGWDLPVMWLQQQGLPLPAGIWALVQTAAAAAPETTAL